MIRKRIFVLPFFILLSACSSGNSGTEETKITDSFPGITSSVEKAPTRSAKVLIVHGIGCHLPNYSEPLQMEVLERLGFSLQPSKVSLVRPLGRGFVKVTEGRENILAARHGGCGAALDQFDRQRPSVLISTYERPDESRLTFFEVTWSPISQVRKIRAIGFDARDSVRYERAHLNDLIKHGIINDRLSDAVVYLGDGRSEIQNSVVLALCYMWHVDDFELDQECDLAPENTQAIISRMKLHRYAIITFSLGSKIVFDTITEISKNDDLREIADEMYERTDGFYMLANQIPFLEVANASAYGLTGPDQDPFDVIFGGLEEKLKQVALLSDQNDIEKQMTALESELEVARKNALELLYRKSSAERSVNTLSEIGDLQDEIRDEEDHIIDLGEERDGLQTSANLSDKAAEGAITASEKEEDIVAELNTEVRDNEATVGELNEQLSQINEMLDTGRLSMEETNDYRKKISSAKNAATFSRVVLARTQTDISDIDREIATWADRLERLIKGDLEWFESIVESLSRQFGSMTHEQQLAYIKDKLSSLEVEKEEHVKIKVESETAITEQDEIAESTTSALENLAEERETEKNKKNRILIQLQLLSDKNVQLGKQIKASEDKAEKLREDASAAQKEAKSLRIQAGESNQEAMNTEAYKEVLKARLHEKLLAGEQALQESRQDTVEGLRAFELLYNSSRIAVDARLLDLVDRTLSDVDARSAGRQAVEALKRNLVKQLESSSMAVVAFTDPNDLLGYPIPPRLAQSPGQLKFVNVSTQLTNPFLGLYADPVLAHSNHTSSQVVMQLLSCGATVQQDGDVILGECDDQPAASYQEEVSAQ